jgi:pimeloyl-ACP methyl ester carboxylesterase
MNTDTIYKNRETKEQLMKLYEEKLASLAILYSEKDVPTQFGVTRVVQTGNPKGKQIVLFHGINAGAPITLEAVKGLVDDYSLIVIETVGQATKSEGAVMNIKDDSFAVWADEVFEYLKITNANIVGISYGAFIVGKIIKYKPERIGKCVLVVPSGIVNGDFWESMKKLTFPLIKWQITKKESDLTSFINAFIPKGDTFMHQMLSVMMKGVKLDTRIPPLLKVNDIKHFDKPVYVISADNDVYFPGEKVLTRSAELFSNLKETYLLKDSNHMPAKSSFPEIQKKLREWV